MAGPKSTSKTHGKQRAVPAADIDRIVPLSDGSHAYVYYPNGNAPRFKTNSAEFANAVRDITKQGYGTRIRTQIEALATQHPNSKWPTVREFLDSENVYTTE